MKRIYTIGRDPQCDILIQDVRGVVSRVHAVLRVESNGKMYIKDQSMNGTYINGMRVTANVEIPVSRKDVINFANVMDLDWTIIPNPAKKRMEIIDLTEYKEASLNDLLSLMETKISKGALAQRFDKILKLAEELNLPVAIHARDSIEDVYKTRTIEINNETGEVLSDKTETKTRTKEKRRVKK